jgi:RNA polymerase sigma-70 factor (ECF subfamily)
MNMPAGPTAANHTTALLLHRIRGGDERARAELAQRVQPLLLRFAHGRIPQLLRHQQETGDLIQATWLRVLQRLEVLEVNNPGDFFAYLRAALVNALRETLRRQGRAPVLPPGGPGDIADHDLLPAAEVSMDDWLEYEQALARLPHEHRVLVLMRFEFGLSFVEIASELGETSDGVRMKFNRALSRMTHYASG